MSTPDKQQQNSNIMLHRKWQAKPRPEEKF